MSEQNRDRDLLEELFHFMVGRSYVEGDEASIRDMVKRYKQPPLTLYHRACMQMTKADYDKLDNLLERIVEHFNPDRLNKEMEYVTAGDRPDSTAGDVSLDTDAEQRSGTG